MVMKLTIFFLLAVLQISRFMSVNKLKYFFAVDTKYVIKKLMLLLFPYTHQVTIALSRQAVITRTCILVTMMSFQHHFRKCFVDIMCLMDLIFENSRQTFSHISVDLSK